MSNNERMSASVVSSPWCLTFLLLWLDVRQVGEGHIMLLPVPDAFGEAPLDEEPGLIDY